MPAAGTEITLGISDSHDAGVAIVRDGTVLAAINEERLNRIKMFAGVPLRSLEQIWRVAGVEPRQVTGVGVAGIVSAGAPPINNDFTDDNGRAAVAQVAVEMVDRLPGGGALIRNPLVQAVYRQATRPVQRARVRRLTQLMRAVGVSAPVSIHHHHDCHLASAYYTSGFDRALVVSNDGFGDTECSRVAVAADGKLTVVARNGFVDSLGVYYNYVTLYCGFPKSHHAGKTTGLAAFGDPARTAPVFQSLIPWDERRGMYINRGRLFRNCIRDVHRRLDGASREDAAAGIQQHCEQVLASMVRHWTGRTGERNLVLVGGVHANVKANQRIAAVAGVDRVSVFPNMGDGGLALGAAFLARRGGFRATERLAHAYLGGGYPDAEIEEALRAARLPFSRPAGLATEVARHLAERRLVARFDGRMEYGPRALGNRSILYSAVDPSVNAWLNRQLKRTEFMPFAPVLRIEDAPAFLDGFDAKTAHPAEFMTITYDVTERCKREAPAVVHVDGTARPQVLRRDVNPGYYDILAEYQRLTGLSVLVNTSFNMHEEPIVCTPQDAVNAFLASNLDVLVAGPFLVTNDRKAPR
jgi:carbamoyltransferase